MWRWNRHRLRYVGEFLFNEHSSIAAALHKRELKVYAMSQKWLSTCNVDLFNILHLYLDTSVTPGEN
jgi:hypothetical protein